MEKAVDEEVMATRDHRGEILHFSVITVIIPGMRLLHIAVLREKHELLEHLARTFPDQIDLVDTVNKTLISLSRHPKSHGSSGPCAHSLSHFQLGRTALHYAAAQQNAIYDTLVDIGARKDLPDQDGVTAEEYRQDPGRLVRPSSAVSSLMLRSMSTDDEFFDPGEFLL